MTTKQVQLLRGTIAQHCDFVGDENEITYVTDRKELRRHDGITPGGNVIVELDDDFQLIRSKYQKNELLRRGTDEQHKVFIGAEGELTFVTDLKEARIHDGITPGGKRIPVSQRFADQYD